MSDRTRTVVPVDEQRVREIIREELGIIEAKKSCPACQAPKPKEGKCNGWGGSHPNCPYMARAL
jgi:hypothetical protein